MSLVCEFCEKEGFRNRNALVSHKRMAHSNNPMKDPKTVKKMIRTSKKRGCYDKLSVMAKKRWKNPSFRKRVLPIIIVANKTFGKRKKTSERLKGKKKSKKHIQKVKLWFKSPEGINHRKKLSRRMKKYNPMFDPKIAKKQGRAEKGKHRTKESKQRQSETFRTLWTEPKYISKMMKALSIKPNKIERKLNQILQKYFPNEWKYNGNFSCGVTIGGMIPDFVNVNGKKQVIELYGDYWHKNDNPQDRIDAFKKYGYDCVIIWEHELKDKTKRYINKIRGMLLEAGT